MIKIVNLHTTLNPINPQERIKINENWDTLQRSISSLQSQINFLSGGQEIDAIIQRIDNAVSNAETNTQNAIDNVNSNFADISSEISRDLIEIRNAINESNNATSDAENARDSAIAATTDAINAINEINTIINNFQYLGEWNNATNYLKNNMVAYQGQSYIALKNSVNTPVSNSEFWNLFASKGEKGDKGDTGDPGAALSIRGSLDDVSELPFPGQPGWAYTINGELWVWSENINNWANVGNIKGIQGEPGPIGPSGVDGISATHQFNGTILTISSASGTSSSDLIGPKGDVGPMGPQGPPGSSANVPNASTTVAGIVQLNNSLTSTSTTMAPTANALKNVNDKFSSNNVVIGNIASASTFGVAIGYRASASGVNAVAIGSSASAPNLYEGMLGVGPSGDGPRSWVVPGNISVSGTKNFEIPHPKPDKNTTHVIRHGAVESPTAGDTLYRYTIEAKNNEKLVELQLPDYFEHLNTNVDVWVNPYKHFGRAYGEVIGDKLYVTCETNGIYKVLIIGTRNDDHESVRNWHIKGVEREIGESWTGETYAFEVEEILDTIEIEEVIE